MIDSELLLAAFVVGVLSVVLGTYLAWLRSTEIRGRGREEEARYWIHFMKSHPRMRCGTAVEFAMENRFKNERGKDD